MVEPVKALAKKVGSVKGASKIKSSLSKARRELKKRKSDKEKALKHIDKALALYAEQVTWRQRAGNELVPGLTAYAAQTRDTFGTRQQVRMTDDQALFVASCSAGHRDLSLNF